ncbi:MAG: tetratricopeptide repeat-containing protein kinase family protein, partial [Myxococcota bacterium]
SSTGGSSARRAIVDVTLTRTGAIMGTPAYMSPEQGKDVDARADQFSFCVALYEALYRERPFAGDNLADLRFNVMRGNLRPRPRGHDVPAWLRAAVLRGLAVDPDERWPTMLSLIAALERDPTARRRQLLAGGSGALALGGVFAWASFTAPNETALCDGGQARAAEVWNEGRSEQMHAAFERAVPDEGDALHAGLATALDDFSSKWAEAHRDACQANKIRREQSDDLFDRRMRCLGRRLEKVDALIGVYESPTEGVAEKAESAAGALPSLEPCADVEALAAQVPPPEDPAVRETWDRLHRDLDRADALGVAGNEVASLALYDAVTPEVTQLEHPPLTARLVLNHGNALVRQQRWSEAITVLDPGPGIAAASHDAVVEAQMWLLLAKATGFGLNDSKTGSTMARAAEVAAIRAGDVPDVAIGIQYTLSLLRDADGDYEGAVAHADKAVKLAIAEYGKEHRTTSTLYGNLGSVLEHAGRYDDAMKANETSLAIDMAKHGETHPEVAHSLVNIGVLLQNQGEYDVAKEKFEQALQIYDGTVGRKHGAYTTAMVNLGQNAFYRLKFEEARDRFLTLLELYRQTMPEVSDDIAMVHQNLGTAYKHLEDLESAETHYRQAYRIREQVFGDEHPKVMHSMNAMAMVLAHKGDFAESEKQLRRAVDVGEKAFPEGHPDLAYPLQNLGDVLAEQGRFKDALPFMERAVQLRADINPNLLGRSEFALGRVLCFVDRKAGEAMLDQAAAKLDELGKKEVASFRASLEPAAG